MSANPHVVLNGALIPREAAQVSATSDGFLFGHGVFETINVLKGRPVFLAQHHARLTASADALGLPYSTSIDMLRERIAQLIAANSLNEGAVKVAVFNPNDASTIDPSETIGELITTRPTVYPETNYTRGFHLQTILTGERTGALSAHKTFNYLANIRAKRAAVAAGFDEALFVTPAGIVIEGATTNIFVVRDGVAFTPPLAAGPLPGIARSEVLALLGPNHAREILLTRADLQHAEEIFLTNALLGVMPVSRIDKRTLPLPAASVVPALRAAFRDRQLASIS